MEITVRDAIRDAIAEEMRRDASVFILGEDIATYGGAYKTTRGLLDEFGEKRVIDTPITEYGFSGLAVGAALAGLRPIVEFMSWNFGLQAIDHIINSAAKMLYMSGGEFGCPIVFRGPNGAAAKVGAQHSQCFASWYAHCPGLKVVAPRDAMNTKAILKAAIRDNNPVLVLENELLYGTKGPVHDADYIAEIGKCQIIREGQDVTIVSFSNMLNLVEKAADLAKAQNISCEIIDLLSIRPLDFATIKKSIQKTNHLIIVEEGWLFCGVGAEIVALANSECFDYLDSEPLRIGMADVPLAYAANLEAAALPTIDSIVLAIEQSLMTSIR